MLNERTTVSQIDISLVLRVVDWGSFKLIKSRVEFFKNLILIKISLIFNGCEYYESNQTRIQPNWLDKNRKDTLMESNLIQMNCQKKKRKKKIGGQDQ